MKATLEFNLPEDEAQFRIASRSMEMASILSQIDMQLRGWIKHGHDFKSVDDALIQIRGDLAEAVLIANGE